MAGIKNRRIYILLFAAILTTFCCHQTQAQTRTTTIILKNYSDAKVIPTIQIQALGGTSQDFKPTELNTFEAVVPLPSTKWFERVDISLRWKDAYRRANGSNADFVQRIVLLLRHDFQSQFTVPIFFSNDRSDPEMGSLEQLKDINDQFEVFLRAWQIARFYHDTLGPKSGPATRMARDAFWAAAALATQPPYTVVMSEEVVQLIKDAFPGSTSYATAIDTARSTYWNDLNYVNTFVSQHQCADAKLVMQAFRGLASVAQAQDLMKLRFRDESDPIGERQKLVDSCAGG